MCSPLLEAQSLVTFLSLTEERLAARLRLIVLTIVEYVELTMWYWEGGRGEEGGREVCTSLSLPFHCGCKNCFSCVKGICYRILCSESTFTNPRCLHN